MKASVVFTEAKKFIDSPEKWTKGTLENCEGAFCSLGAIRAALFDLYGGLGNYYDRTVDQGDPSFWDLADYITDKLDVNLVGFNDAPSTTHEDVLKLFDKVIEVALVEEAS